jgi:hypothetical protein
MREIWMGYTTNARAKEQGRLIITGNRQLEADIAADPGRLWRCRMQFLLFVVIAKPVDTAISGALGLVSHYLETAADGVSPILHLAEMRISPVFSGLADYYDQDALVIGQRCPPMQIRSFRGSGEPVWVIAL